MAPSARNSAVPTGLELERRRQAIAEALREVMAEPAAIDDASPEPDDEGDERVTVPPFEPAGGMSADASRTLFGGH